MFTVEVKQQLNKKAPKKKSELGLHYLLRCVCPNTLNFFGVLYFLNKTITQTFKKVEENYVMIYAVYTRSDLHDYQDKT